MKTVAIVAARLGSSRLPGKVLAEVAGRPLLWHVVNRARQAKKLDDVVVATSFSGRDLALVAWCQNSGIPVLRGGAGENDVLGRFRDVALLTDAEIIVRICGDSPLIAPAEIDRVVAALEEGAYGYVTNAPEGLETLPDGLDCEAFTLGALLMAHETATMSSDREHVTPWMRRELAESSGLVESGHGDYSHLRFCVDDEQDLEFANAVFAALGDNFAWPEVVQLLEDRPEIAALMGTAQRNEGLARSRREDFDIGN